MHRNCIHLFEKYAKPLFVPGRKVLEIGPEAVPSAYRSLVADVPLDWETIDLIEHPDRTYVAQGEYRFPIPDGSYDVVISANVIEHVRKIWVWMAELARVCKKGGTIITVNPVNWPYHEAPIDCWRIYPEGMRALCEEVGLAVKLCRYEQLDRRFARSIASFAVRGAQFYLENPLRRALRRVGASVPLRNWEPWHEVFATDMITIAEKPLESAT